MAPNKIDDKVTFTYMARDTVRHVLVVGFRRQFFLERLDLVWSRSFSVVSLNHHCFSSALLPGP